MTNRKKPTNKELLDMNIWLRERLDIVTKFSQDTAMVLNTYIKMKGDDKALFRELRKKSENETKNQAIKKTMESTIKGASNAKKTDQASQAGQSNR